MAVVIETGEELTVGDPGLFDMKTGKFKPHHFRQCMCVEKKRRQRMFKSSQIPEKYQSVGFKGFVVDGRPACIKDARDTALDYYQSFGRIRSTADNSLLIVGAPDTGKTHLLMAVANGLMRQDVSVLYFPWVEGMNELKENLDEVGERTSIMKTVDLLYIDDLYKGRRKPTDFAKEQIYGVINFRYNNRLPMLVSSEYSPDELFEIDTGIARRVYEPSKSHRVLMGLAQEEKSRGMVLSYNLQA